MKAAVVCERFRRLAGIDVAQLLGEVRDLPGGLLGWRTRITYAVDASGRVGLHRHRSRELEHVDQCPLGVPLVGDAPEIGRRWPGLSGLEINSGDGGARSVIAHRPGPGRQPRGRRPPDRVEVIDGAEALLHRVGERELRVRPTGFWQVHPHALRAFADEVVAATGVREGDRVLDLFAGAGALTVVLAEATGSTGSVLGLESDAGAVADAAANLADLPWAGVRRRRVDATSLGEHANRIDVVVLDPPRAGIGREVMTAVLALGARAVCYVSCDAATLARDVRAALDTGWRLTRLTAFDAFPMTAHVEVIATLVPPEAGS
jgi:tRNA/tmRNA/rRNA uracil-C5-methylase (TrmA/RlmC/RlmD family)